MNILNALKNTALKSKEYVDKNLTWNKLQDRPFGEEPGETVLETTTVTMDMYMEAFGAFYVQKNIELIEGESYIVTYNGTEYECKCGRLPFDTGEANVMINYVGNSLPLNNVNSGEPFFISDATPVLGGGIGFGYIDDSSDSSWEIGIVKKGAINYLDSKYIKDMYYSEEKDVFIYETQETRVGYVTSDNTSPATFVKLGFEIGKTYKVIWNGVEYTCEAFEATMAGMTGVGVGNVAVIGGENTGEPFIIADVIGVDYGVVIDLTATSMGTATFGVMQNKEVVSKYIDPKYIKDMYYDDVKVILPMSTLTCNDTYNTYLGAAEETFRLEIGEKYVVTFNGKKYECTAYKDDKHNTYVNAMLGGSPDYPFEIMEARDDDDRKVLSVYCSGITSVTPYTFTIEITKGEIHKIDDKYLDLSTKKLSELQNDLYGDIDKLEDVYSAKWGDDSQFIVGDEKVRIILINIPTTPLLVAGVTYIVEIDDIKYRLISEVKSEQYGIYDIGNKNIQDSSCENTGEPFYIVFSKYDGTTICLRPNTSFETISIKKVIGTTTKQIESKYLEMPYGEKEVVLFPEEIVTLEDGQAELSSIVNFEVGKEYIMNINGVDYPCTAYQATYNDMPFIGIGCEGLLGGETESLTEPCVIGTSSYEGYRFTAIMAIDSSVTSMKVSVRGMDISYIDSKYIKDMYYSEEYVSKNEIVPEIVLEFPEINYSYSNANGMFYLNKNDIIFTKTPDVGKTYEIKWNETIYTCVAQSAEAQGIPFIALGNMSFDEVNAQNTGEPFYITFVDYAGYRHCNSATNSSGYATLSINEVVEAQIIHKIDNKYIDAEWMATKKDTRTVVLSETTIEDIIGGGSSGTGNSTSYSLSDEAEFTLVKGKKYIVNFDSVEYYCELMSGRLDLTDEDILYMGNLNISGLDIFSSENKITNEPFLFASKVDEQADVLVVDAITILTETSTSTKISITEVIEEYNKLPPEFIKDMYYTKDPEEVALLNTTSITIGSDLYTEIPNSLVMGEGKTYIVTFEETRYECVAWYSSHLKAVVVGSGAIVGEAGQGGNEPFAINSYSNGSCYLNTSTTGTYTISISAMVSEVIQLDRKYISDHIDKLPGEKVAGKVYTIDSESITAEKCSEVFNDYTNNIASGQYSHAEGMYTQATGMISHAEGYNAKATGGYSHAEGSDTTASGYYSHAEGNYTNATGDQSHAEGHGSTASGYYSHAQGGSTTASGNASHAEGNGSVASGESSHAEGQGTIASSENQHVQGKFNVEDAAGKYAHIVGNGDNGSKRSNAHTLDWDGNAWFGGSVECTAIILKSSTAGSGKRFKITVDDSGTLSTTEITA